MLKLKQLSLDGFLSYDKAVIPLDSEGITFIQGETGAGKSTIFEAILYILYSKTLRKRLSANDLENKVLNKGFDISLIFEIDNVEYTVREVRNRTGENGFYLYEGTTDIRGKTDSQTRSKLHKIIKITDEEFKNLVFLGQRQSQKFIDGTSGERAELISELFNLQKYDSLLDKSEKALKSVTLEKERAVSFMEDIQRNISDLYKTLEKQGNIEKVDENLIPELEIEVAQLDADLKRFRFDEGQSKEVLARVEVSKKNIKKLQEVANQIENLKESLSAYPTARYSYAELSSMTEKGRIKKGYLFQKVEKKEQELQEIGVLGDICPISNKECSLKIPTQYKEEREKIIQKDLEKLSTEIDEISEKLDKIHRLLTNAEEVDLLNRQLEQKTALFASLKDSVGDMGDIDVESYVQKVAFYSQKITILEKKIKEKTSILNDLRTKKCLFEQQETYRNSITTLLMSKQEELVKKQQEIENLSNKSQYLAAASKIFKNLKLYKIDLILERINFNIQEQLSRISDSLKINFSSIRTGSRGKSLDQLNISVTNGSVVLPLEMLSGGQTTQMGLAILLGMYKTVYELSEKSVNLLFLDEAFGTLSDDIIDETFDSIVNLTKELGFNNVKIISHRELDSRKFDHFWQISRINGLSSLSVLS